ncbi:SecY-interacting protein [Shewanella sp. CG12_big_fil_rev_8_21_14_0_65_47_15]|uniref:SecY-interacting protein n=1 Tax=Shewanella sp. CG12_big_fil_rev_8_21_14_0_65_47_15 TaxID=1975537 RepID=UPI000CAAA962|nr:SecY-interacting protein [Shewanella sp. CG12_big_fil_rev_8_21_14_0_65_47_15]PIW59057.1 MAG: SecY-interacting protein [Shewanella sp. CG12_big_fil_rev_8_21_14_0_65_47_15]
MSCLSALDKFLQNYHQAYLTTLGELPRYYPQGEPSLCIQGELPDMGETVAWKPIKRDEEGSFVNLEHALDLKLWPDIHSFYGQYFAAPLLFDSKWGTGELLQAWNEDDFNCLQQNIIGHLMMKKQLKQPPTWFIGLLDDGDNMLTVNNADGSVWIEIPGEIPTQQLSPSLAEFIGVLSPRIAPPVKHEELPMPALEHPGIFASFKRMWHNLTGKR